MRVLAALAVSAILWCEVGPESLGQNRQTVAWPYAIYLDMQACQLVAEYMTSLADNELEGLRVQFDCWQPEHGGWFDA